MQDDKQIFNINDYLDVLSDGIPPDADAEISLESILAEFGQSGVEKAPFEASAISSPAPSPASSPEHGRTLRASESTVATIEVAVKERPPEPKQPETEALREPERAESRPKAPAQAMESQPEAAVRRPEQVSDTLPEATEAEDTAPEEDDNTATDRKARKKNRVVRERPKKEPAPEPVKTMEELLAESSNGLSSLGVRTAITALLCLPMLYIVLSPLLSWPLPGLLSGDYRLCAIVLAGIEVAAAALGYDILGRGAADLFRLRPGAESAVLIAFIATLADAASMIFVSGRDGFPYSAVWTASLVFTMWGTHMRRSAVKKSCRTATFTKRPVVITLEKDRREDAPVFVRGLGNISGFAARMGRTDGATRLFHLVVPITLTASLVFAILCSVGRGDAMGFFRCWAAITSGAAPFSLALAYPLPFSMLTKRLSDSGAALAGWDGACASSEKGALVISDGELFPPGTVSLNGMKVMGGCDTDKLLSYTISLLKTSGCGIAKAFDPVVRDRSVILKTVTQFQSLDGGGFAAYIGGERVLVGTPEFIKQNGVVPPARTKVKYAVYTAIGSQMAGIFALKYNPSGNIRNSLMAAMQSRIPLLLAVRDFNITPAMLKSKFRIRRGAIEYPDIRDRLRLSRQYSSLEEPLAVVCREGLAPFSDTVVGGRRLRGCVRVNAALTAACSALGVLIMYYLSYTSAFAQASPANLLIYHAMWAVPTFFISKWVSRF